MVVAILYGVGGAIAVLVGVFAFYESPGLFATETGMSFPEKLLYKGSAMGCCLVGIVSLLAVSAGITARPIMGAILAGSMSTVAALHAQFDA